MTLELRHPKYIIAVANHRSFRRGVDVIGVHQSAIGRRIRSLENELGPSLFNRHSGYVDGRLD